MKSSIKIVHIISGLPTGGAERMLIKLIENSLKKINHIVISLRDEGDQGQFIKELGIPLFELKIKGSIPDFKAFQKLNRIIKNEKPDVIQAWMYHGNIAALIVGHYFRKIPVIFNIRHSLHDIKSEKKTTQLAIHLNSLLSKKANAIIYNSNISQRQHENFGFSKSTPVIITNGFNTHVFKPDRDKGLIIRENLGISIDDFLFVQIGRNHPMKNHRNFIKAAAEIIKNSEQKKYYFLIVGEDIDHDSKLHQLIVDLKIQKQVFLWGQRQDIEYIWNAADCGVLSSSWGEGFPNVIGEAMACGKPCIVTDIGDSAFVVGNSGFVVPPNNIAKMVATMTKVITMPFPDLKDIGRNARNRIINNFGIEKISAQYLQLYKSVLNQKEK